MKFVIILQKWGISSESITQSHRSQIHQPQRDIILVNVDLVYELSGPRKHKAVWACTPKTDPPTTGPLTTGLLTTCPLKTYPIATSP